ncbi:MAG: hypothetical protein IJZ82_02925 [Lachnospiraceae bacterium]|nr:hypothetical protein [Lachnospiraceae bacterium]
MNKYIEYLEDTIKELQKEEEALILASRKDEANFVKIKINICDISKTIYNASAKTNTGDALEAEYLRQLTKLPENWRISLDKAREHGDIQKSVIEEIKLEMLQTIKTKFEELGACE